MFQGQKQHHIIHKGSESHIMGKDGRKHLAFITRLILNYYLSTGIQKPASDAIFF